MLNGNMFAYTYWIEIELIVCHCLIIEWHLGCKWDKAIAWLRCSQFMDMVSQLSLECM